MLKKMTATVLAASMVLGSCISTFAKNNTEIKTVNSITDIITTTTTTTTTTASPQTNKPAEIVTEVTSEETTEVTTEITTEVITEETSETTTESTTESTMEITTEETTETTTEVTTESTTETTTEAAAETTTVTEESAETATKPQELVTMAEAAQEASNETESVTEAVTEIESTETTTRRFFFSSSSDNTFTIDESYDIYIDLKESVDLSNRVSNLINSSDYDWNCTDKRIVSLDEDGTITGLKAGKATVSAYYYNGQYYFQYVFRIYVDSEEITDKRDFTIYAEATKDLSGYVSKVADASDYSWSSENKSVATVSGKGVVKGKKKGTTKINARYHNGKYDYNYVFNITVKDSKSTDSAASTIVNKTVWTLYIPTGNGVYLEDFLTKSYGDYKWQIENENIISFRNGKVTGLRAGSSKITASIGTSTYTFTINVSDKYETVTANIKVNNTLNIKSALSGDFDDYDISSDREPVAVIDKDGNVTGKAMGMATIIAKNNKTGKLTQVICNVSNLGTTKLGTKTTASGKSDLNMITSAKNEFKGNTESAATAAEETTQIQSSSFVDIAHRTWAITAIENMSKRGYIVGTGGGLFEPDGTTKRADFTIVLVKMFGLEGDGGDLYEDVQGNEYYAEYVRKAKTNGIEGGVSENCFRPKDAITREEIFVMIYKAMKQRGIELNEDVSVLDKYSDNSWINDDNREAIAALVNKGIVVGTGDELEITSYITRAQMAVLLDNVDDYLQ